MGLARGDSGPEVQAMGALHDDLCGPGVERVETHGAWVFLGKDTVWKVKKPVDFGFLDFTTPEKRRAACEAEVRLNSRLSPHVYLGLVDVVRDATGTHRIGSEGAIVDTAVSMVRLSDSARADVLLRNGKLGVAEMDRLAEHVAGFHRALGPSDAARPYGTPEAILGNVCENFAQASVAVRAHLSETQARDIERSQIEFVERKADLLKRRIADGRVRDGHGDLRLEHVYFDGRPEPTIIDCIEFTERFRFEDVCSDIAFLSMDLRREGRADLAERFLASYARYSGDYELYELVDFYEGYRPYVRGKVSSMLAEDARAEFETRARARADARSFFLLSLLSARDALIGPTVVAVGGLIASGKSTVAERLGELLDAPVLSADWVRKQLAAVSPTERMHDAPWSGAYTASTTDRVYRELFRRAGHVLSSGRPVVLDASFRARAFRDSARSLARQHGAPFRFIECRASLDECRRRLAERERSPSVSDGRLEIFDEFAARYEPITELPDRHHLVVDTTLPIDENVAFLEGELETWPDGFGG